MNVLNLMFYIFNVSVGNNEWQRALYIEGKWYAFDWGWYCDTHHESDVMGLRDSDPALWDGSLKSLVPLEGILWATPESDKDSGPYYTYMSYAWVKENLGVTLPE